MENWELLDPEDWDELDEFDEYEEYEDYDTFLLLAAFDLADMVFLSNPNLPPSQVEDYDLGHLDAREWLTPVQLLDDLVDIDILLDSVTNLNALLPLPAVPSQVLEDPLGFLSSILDGNLPKEPSGRKVGSPKLVKIAQSVLQLVRSFPGAAQATVRTWATIQRNISSPFADDLFMEDDMAELLLDANLPPAMSGFSSLVALTLMRWPERAEGVPLPPEFSDPELYGEVLAEWESLPSSPTVTQEGSGEAEALFAQGQLAHILARTGTLEMFTSDDLTEEDQSLAYSRLSRAILWVHNQCRHCTERDGIACRVASNWPDKPAHLLDIAGEIANTNQIAGCIKM